MDELISTPVFIKFDDKGHIKSVSDIFCKHEVEINSIEHAL